MIWMLAAFVCLLISWMLPMLDYYSEHLVVQIAIVLLRGFGIFALGIGFGTIFT